MANGIVGKIWNIKAGSQGRSSSAQISDSINYITNSEKCDGSIKGDSIQQMGRELHYVTNDIKTLEGLYVGCRNITDVKNALNEMMQIKEYYGKLDGRVALHGIISLDEEESDPSNAGKLMFLLNDLMEEIFPQNQVVYAVHTNTDNLHIHFIANTVGMDGKKIHMDKSFMSKQFDPALNRLAEKYGFTQNEQWKKTKGRDKVSFEERKIQLRRLIDLAVEETEDFASFISYLRYEGVIVNVGKNIAVQLDEMPKAIRTGQLGDNYTIERIKERITSKREAFLWKSMENHIGEITPREMVSYVPSVMKEYKDMNPEEKKKTVSLLRMGRNPWKERWDGNWKMKQAAEELDRIAGVYEIIQYFAPETRNIDQAMEEIVGRQKQIAAEKKEIKVNLKAYKPQMDLYGEMKKYQTRAYLYDVMNGEEYMDDYQKYKKLSERMKVVYDKSIDEVADFVTDQNNQLLYAQAQSKELSAQYKVLKKYKNKQSEHISDEKGISLFDAVGHKEARMQASYGVYVSRIRYITSEKAKDVSIRVITRPDMVDGKNTVVTDVSVIGKDGEVLEEFGSDQMDSREFGRRVYALQGEYRFESCEVKKDGEFTKRWNR